MGTEAAVNNNFAELYGLIKEYSEYSTVAGLIYIFMEDQSRAGKVFWILVILSMLNLRTYWSVAIYNDWKSQPVLTTAKTTGKCQLY